MPPDVGNLASPVRRGESGSHSLRRRFSYSSGSVSPMPIACQSRLGMGARQF
jgi:hypothetical protein